MLDLVVIGAGPAGTSAAYHAAAAGQSVLLVDRIPFPRTKTCGDALSPRALAAVRRMGLPSLPGHPVEGVRMRRRGSRGEHYERFWNHVAPHQGVVLVREVLDRLLLERALGAGAEFLIASGRHLIEHEGRVTGVSLETPDGPLAVSARAVIGATGSAGLPRFDPRARIAWGVAARTYLRTVQDFGGDLEVYFPVRDVVHVLFGYGWVFPTGTRQVNVGVGVIHTGSFRGPSLQVLLDDFIRWRQAEDPRLDGAAICGQATSAPIAIGPPLRPRPGFLPVGDLAGLANPFTGEGIATALESGELAAHAVVQGGGDAANRYIESVARLLPRHASLSAALPRIYRQPWLLLERGGDVITSPASIPGGAMRRLTWDASLPRGPWSALDPVCTRRAVESVRVEILRGARRLRPLLAELLTSIMHDPSSAFGWYTAFGAAIGSGAGMPEPHPSAGAQAVFVVLETLNLVTRLHADLRSPGDSAVREGVWGSNTLGLMLADALTANALRRLYDLKPSWSRKVSDAAQAAMRSHAAGRSVFYVESLGERAAAAAVLSRLAASAGLDDLEQPLPSDLGIVADRFGDLLTNPRDHEVDAMLGVLAGCRRTPWTHSIKALLSTLTPSASHWATNTALKVER